MAFFFTVSHKGMIYIIKINSRLAKKTNKKKNRLTRFACFQYSRCLYFDTDCFNHHDNKIVYTVIVLMM